MQGAPAAHAIHQSQTPAFSKHFFSRLTLFFPALSSPFHLRSSTAQLDRVFLHKSKERLVYSPCCQAFDWSFLPNRQCAGSLWGGVGWGGVGRGHSVDPANLAQSVPTLLTPSHPGPAERPVLPLRKRAKMLKYTHTNDFYIDERCERVT